MYQCPLKYLNKICDNDECTHEHLEDEYCDDKGESCDFCLATEAYNDAFATMRHAMIKIEKRKEKTEMKK